MNFKNNYIVFFYFFNITILNSSNNKNNIYNQGFNNDKKIIFRLNNNNNNYQLNKNINSLQPKKQLTIFTNNFQKNYLYEKNKNNNSNQNISFKEEKFFLNTDRVMTPQQNNYLYKIEEGKNNKTLTPNNLKKNNFNRPKSNYCFLNTERKITVPELNSNFNNYFLENKKNNQIINQKINILNGEELKKKLEEKKIFFNKLIIKDAEKKENCKKINKSTQTECKYECNCECIFNKNNEKSFFENIRLTESVELLTLSGIGKKKEHLNISKEPLNISISFKE